jgi:exosortase D (VPLPA-CTERM-specific)
MGPKVLLLSLHQAVLSHILETSAPNMANSVEVAPRLSASEASEATHKTSKSSKTGESKLSSGLVPWQAVVLLVLVGWLYGSILVRLFLQWVGPSHDPNFEHGIFVPLFALFILWQDRKKLQAIAPAPSWTGLPLIVLSLLLLVIGVLGAENFSSRVSLLILLAGLIILFRGWKFFRAVLFPWAFLFLMIPIPALIMQHVTFPLQLLATRLATAMLDLINVPVLREGNQIILAAMPLDVAEACSGIRSLLTLVTLSIIYGYLLESRIWVRVVLAFSAVPIAVAANSFRIFGTGLIVQYWDPNKAEGFYHTFSGWLIFVAALIMFFAVHRLISLLWPATQKNNSIAPPDPSNWPARPSPEIPVQNGALRFGIVAILLLTMAAMLQAHPRNEYFPSRAPLNSLPSQIDGWTATDDPLDKQTLDILGPGEFLVRDYRDASQLQPWINLYIAYFPSQRAGDTPHSPSHCLPGGGWIPTSREVVSLTNPNGTSFPVNRFVVSNSGDRQLVLYWFQAHGRAVASEYAAKYYLISDSIRMNRSDGALVRLMTPMLDGESADAAQARMMKLGSQFLPLLDNYIPR